MWYEISDSYFSQFSFCFSLKRAITWLNFCQVQLGAGVTGLAQYEHEGLRYILDLNFDKIGFGALSAF